jgi:formate/nitrite transporter
MANEHLNFDCKPSGEAAKILCRTTGVAKTNIDFVKLLVLGILAGSYIGFGCAISTLVVCDLAKFAGYGFARFMAGATFSFGLILVVVAGAELFTGNHLMLMTVYDKKAEIKKVLWKWVIVYLANFIGAVMLAYIMYKAENWKVENFSTGLQALKIAHTKAGLTFGVAFFRGVLCNWLVCLGVYMATCSRSVIDKIFACFFPIMVFIALGFEHSIANMYYIPLGMLLRNSADLVTAATVAGIDVTNITWINFIKNLIPVSLGNIVGGGLFVGTAYWIAHLRTDKE